MATWFLPFRSLTVTVPTSNKIQKGFLSKKNTGKIDFLLIRVPSVIKSFPKSTQGSSDITSDEYEALFSEPKL